MIGGVLCALVVYLVYNLRIVAVETFAGTGGLSSAHPKNCGYD